MSEENVVSAVSADNVRAHVEHITHEIPLAAGRAPPTASAWPNTARGAHARRAYRRDDPRVARARELSRAGRVAGRWRRPRSRSRPTRSGHSLPTLADGLSGELIDVGVGRLRATTRARTRAARSRCPSSPITRRGTRSSASPALMGAIGCVMMNWGHPENTAVPFGSVKPVWGNPTPETCKTEMATLPCIGIARTAGLKLREMLNAGPGARLVPHQCRERLAAGADHGRRDQGPRADDFVMVGGHQDSWPGPQATDNAAGNACMIELARVFKQHRDKLRRGLVVRLLDRARDRHHGRLVLVRRPQLGPAARARGRLSADRPAGLRRHDALEHRLQRRAQALPPGASRSACSATGPSPGSAR